MNPFRSQVVDDPRQIEPAVAGLNEEPLRRLLSLFAELKAGHRMDRAPVVLSPEPGYGKSHLIGRLFQRLEGEATCIYLRPFEAVDRCWDRILDRIVRELVRVDLRDSEESPGRPRTQLDRMSALTVGHLTADLFDRSLVRDEELPARWKERSDDLRALLRTNPLELWEGPDAGSWIDWITRPSTFTCLPPGLWGREIEFGSVRNPHSWLKVLLAYLAYRDDPGRHRLCTDWMRAVSLDPEEAAFLGMATADLPSAESSLETANELAKERILDFCRLARFARPFLFCFDQTEAFGQDPQRAARFGFVVAELVDQAPNQMLVITANREPWERRILPEIETAYRDRMRYADPALHLSGLNESQARLLLQSRMRRAGVDPGRTERFSAGPWLPGFFSKAKVRGIRFFLQEAERRWEEKGVPPPDLLRGYEAIVERMRKEPPSFDPDALQWLLREGGHSLPGWEVEEPYPGPKKHLLLRWKKNGTAVGFGWEAGSHWKRWEALARQTEEEAKLPHGCRRSIFLRSFDQPVIPSPRWKSAAEIGRLCQGPMRIEPIDPAGWIPLAALYELHAKVLEGDLPFPREETLVFVRERLRPWAESLIANLKGEPPPPVAEPKAAITVSELVERCLRKGSAPPPDRAELGTAFHRIVEEFARRLPGPGRSPGNPEEYWTILRESARGEFEARRKGGAAEEAEYLEAALRAFHQNLKAIAASGSISRWKELFEGTEIPISATFAGREGRSVRVEGRLDTLRRHPREGRQIVDYKLCRPSDSPRDLLQLAIYAEILRQDPKGSPFSGVLEYYDPSLTVRTAPEAELRALFSERVRPVLETLVGEQERETPPLPIEPSHRETADRIEKFFASHGFALRCVGLIHAPQLLRFQLSCPAGVRVEKLLSLAPTLRVHLGLDFEPRLLPAAGFVAVDLPNPDPFPVSWEEAYRKLPAGRELPLLVGQTVEGEILAADLADANSPHVLVAGTSGSGKSVLLQSFLATHCRALPPARLEVLLIDPKILTFGAWKEIPQLRGRGLITEPEEALRALQETVEEMDRRYRLLADEGFDSLRRRIAAGKTEIPYRVIFFDEFADWLLGARQTRGRFEERVARITQKGRAAGIHLILATQRPEKKVVTGLISANLPLHICLRVSSAVDSRIVLGEGGAEILFGKGDLLCNLGPGGALIRAQAPFVDSPPPSL